MNELTQSHRSNIYRSPSPRHPHAREAAIAEWLPSAPWSSAPRLREGGDAAVDPHPRLIGAGFIVFCQLLMLWMLAREMAVSPQL